MVFVERNKSIGYFWLMVMLIWCLCLVSMFHIRNCIKYYLNGIALFSICIDPSVALHLTYKPKINGNRCQFDGHILIEHITYIALTIFHNFTYLWSERRIFFYDDFVVVEKYSTSFTKLFKEKFSYYFQTYHTESWSNPKQSFYR